MKLLGLKGAPFPINEVGEGGGKVGEDARPPACLPSPFEPT